MKIGTFMMPLHPPSRIPHETLKEDQEAIILADQLGFDEAFVGEHVTDLAENVTSCMMFLASVASATKHQTGHWHDQRPQQPPSRHCSAGGHA